MLAYITLNAMTKDTMVVFVHIFLVLNHEIKFDISEIASSTNVKCNGHNGCGVKIVLLRSFLHFYDAAVVLFYCFMLLLKMRHSIQSFLQQMGFNSRNTGVGASVKFAFDRPSIYILYSLYLLGVSFLVCSNDTF